MKPTHDISKHLGLLLAPFAIFLGLIVFQRDAPSTSANENADSSTRSAPPVAPVRPVTDEYFGQKVVDPYRYMENLKDPEVEKWFKEQDDYARGTLASIPGRAGLQARLKELDQAAPFRVFDVQRMQGEKYFYQKRFANEDVPKLYERD